MLSLVLLIIGFFCFFGAASGAYWPRATHIGWLGLACWILVEIISRGGA